MDEQDQKKALERANSYRDMMTTWAWKDFRKIIDETRQSALERIVWASNLEEVQVQRGFVKCIDSLNSELESILGPL